MQKLRNHPNMQLREDAAASWDRVEARLGVQTVTSAYRPQSVQDSLIWRYDHPKDKYDRPPYLFKPARKSKHTDGIAVDTPNAKALAKLIGENGWFFLYEYDAVHLEYIPAKDKHRGTKAIRPVLRLGARGKDVKDLQTILNKYHGTTLDLDGIFGASTKHAVEMFQGTARISRDGIVGHDTWRKLGQ